MIAHAGIATKKANVGAQRKSFCRSHNTNELLTIPIRSSLFSVTCGLWFNSPEISPQSLRGHRISRVESRRSGKRSCHSSRICPAMDSVARRSPNAARVARGLPVYRRFQGTQQSAVHPALASSKQVLPNAARLGMPCRVTSNFRDEGNVTYQYGGDGKRRTRTAGSSGNAYWRDAGYNVIEEAVGASPTTSNINYVIDHPASSRGNVLADIQGYDVVTGTPRYYSHDHLGSTRTIRNQAKATLARFDYDPYGSPISQGASATRTYTGHDFDSTAGMYFAPFRYYVPGLARWTERDPLGMVDGVNVYVYGRGAAVNGRDPLGTEWPDLLDWLWCRLLNKAPAVKPVKDVADAVEPNEEAGRPIELQAEAAQNDVDDLMDNVQNGHCDPQDARGCPKTLMKTRVGPGSQKGIDHVTDTGAKILPPGTRALEELGKPPECPPASESPKTPSPSTDPLPTGSGDGNSCPAPGSKK